jgi:hypothetical protein
MTHINSMPSNNSTRGWQREFAYATHWKALSRCEDSMGLVISEKGTSQAGACVEHRGVLLLKPHGYCT